MLKSNKKPNKVEKSDKTVQYVRHSCKQGVDCTHTHSLGYATNHEILLIIMQYPHYWGLLYFPILSIKRFDLTLRIWRDGFILSQYYIKKSQHSYLSNILHFRRFLEAVSWHDMFLFPKEPIVPWVSSSITLLNVFP